MSIMKRMLEQKMPRNKISNASDLHTGGDINISLSKRDIDAMVAKLSRFETKLTNKVVRTAVRKSSNEIKERIKFAAPKDSGQLRRNLKVKVRTNKRTGSIYGLIGAKWLEDNKNPAIYMHVLEHGGKHKRKGTNPFAAEAFNASKPQAVARILSELKTGYANAARGL